MIRGIIKQESQIIFIKTNTAQQISAAMYVCIAWHGEREEMTINVLLQTHICY